MGRKSYIVQLKDLLDKEKRKAFCKNENDLSLLLTHLDKEKFDIENIQAIGEVDDFQMYCKENSFETGIQK